VSNREEKAAAAAAAAKKDEAEQKAAALRAKVAADKSKADMNAKIKARAAEHKALLAKDAAVKAEAKLVRHKVKDGETWTHLSLKYYGRTIEPFWRVIYEYPANKALVGDDYKRLRAGMELIIPELPEELKTK
jgi:nucleoid-associated protein YgaU